MIIVEGPDGAGKTTLIRELSARYSVPIAPRVVSKDAEGLGGAGQQWVEDNLADGFQHMIYDRHRLVSEFIYGPALRDKQEPGFTDLIWVEWALERFYRLRPIIIYCLPPLEMVKANVMHDDDNTAVAHRIEAIYAGYAHRIAMEWALGSRPIVWDYTSDGQETNPYTFFDSIFQHAKERANG